jgi:glycosyltransferase involved in cell wall biosynthesis
MFQMTTLRRICLSGIVKNEAAIIERCLASFLPLINTWCIMDTGSTDGTQDKIRSFFDKHKIAGELHEEAFVDFEYTRNSSLAKAQAMLKSGDMCVHMDADEILVLEPGFKLPSPLIASQYTMDIQHGCRFSRTRLYDPYSYQWEYPTHEVLCAIPGKNETCAHLTKAWIDSRTDGARAKDPARWLRDAASLDAAIEVREGNQLWRGKSLKLSRLYFYSGNSYHHAGDYDKAIHRYEQRVLIPEFEEEIFQAYYMRAKCKKELKRPRDEVVGAFLEAYLRRPTRYEPIYHLMAYLMEVGEYEGARLFAAQMMKAVAPNDVLFVEEWCYQKGRELSELLLQPSPAQAIQLATHQYVHKRWAAVLETLRPVKLKDLSPGDKFSYHDLTQIANSWLGRKAEGLAALQKVFLLPLKHWRPHLCRMVGTYVDYYNQHLATLTPELQSAYAKALLVKE